MTGPSDDVTPEPPPKPAGVTKGYLVIWNGKPGPALVAETAVLVDEDGSGTFAPGDLVFQPCVVVDDSDEVMSAAPGRREG